MDDLVPKFNPYKLKDKEIIEHKVFLMRMGICHECQKREAEPGRFLCSQCAQAVHEHFKNVKFTKTPHKGVAGGSEVHGMPTRGDV
jgi:hypothetical protein